jgi:GT2 family glycosyltransferase
LDVSKTDTYKIYSYFGGYLSSSFKDLSPRAAVVIINWNGENFIEQCIKSLLSQTVKPFEIILLDNASSDNSLNIVQRYPLIKLISLNTNTGFARGNNLAIASVDPSVDLIALLNPDAFADPNWLKTLLIAAINHPQVSAFGCQQINAGNPKILDGEGDAYHLSGLVWRSGYGNSVSTQDKAESQIFSPCAAAALYRKSALLEVGGFDEDYFCYVEDVDLGFRLRLAGHQCLYIPSSIVHHVGSGSTGGKNSDFAVYHGHRNLVWTYVKDMPGFLFWLFLPLHLILNLGSLVYFALRGQWSVIWRAKRDAFFGLPLAWQKRKRIQKYRKASLWAIWKVLNKDLIKKH